jgi:hypothetical protein
MGDFTFTSTAECDECGAYLSSSDTECEHDGRTSTKRIFRRLHEGRDSLVCVTATKDYKWHKLADNMDEWIAYQYLGTWDEINSMLTQSCWSSIADLPAAETSLNAPRDVAED